MRHLRYLLVFVLIMVAVLVFSSRFGSWRDLVLLFNEAHKKSLWILLFLEIVYYSLYGLLAKTLLEIAGQKVSLGQAVQSGILGVLGFQVAPFVGAAVMLYCYYIKLKVDRSAIFFLISCLAIFNLANFLIFSFLSAVILPNSFSSLFPERTLLNFLFGLLAVLVTSFFLFRRQAENFIRLIKLLASGANQLTKTFLGQRFIKPERVSQIVAELMSDLDLLLKHRTKTLKAVVLSLFFYLTNAALLYSSFLVFGFRPNLPLLILGFTASSLLTLLSFFPELPGVMEASLITVFTALGFPAHVSLLAALLYRLVSYWLVLPIGLAVYLKNNGHLEKLRCAFFENGKIPE